MVWLFADGLCGENARRQRPQDHLMPSATSVPEPHRTHQYRVGVTLVALLSVLAGMTDAIGFLATGDYVSFMSGNTTRLAIGVGEWRHETTLRLALAVLAFVFGNALGVVMVRACGRRAFPMLLLIGAVLIAVAFAPAKSWPALMAAIVSMGMLNAAVEQVNGSPVGLTYVTGGLSRLGRGIGRWILGEGSTQWLNQLVPWFGMFGGAVLGTLLHTRYGMLAMAGSGALAAMLALIFMVVPRTWQLQYLSR